MRKFWIAAAVILAIAAGTTFWRKEVSGPVTSANEGTATSETARTSATRATPTPNQNGAPEVAANPSPRAADSPPSLASRAASPESPATTDETPHLPPLTVLDNARVAMHNYHEQFGENPVGTNPEITAALLGKNPKHLNFIRPDSGLRVNEVGELVDAYGTPFFFHQLSGREMEIRSAGQDRIMWTYDDLVTR